MPKDLHLNKKNRERSRIYCVAIHTYMYYGIANLVIVKCNACFLQKKVLLLLLSLNKLISCKIEKSKKSWYSKVEGNVGFVLIANFKVYDAYMHDACT